MTFSKLGTDRDANQLVNLPKSARFQGFYIIGMQRMGKSGLMENLIMQDIDQQIGVCVLDPHGELIDHVIARLDPKHEKDVIFLDIHDYKHPFGLNLFTCADLTNPLEVQKTVDQVRHIFEKLLGVSAETPLILEYLRNCTYTLVANPGYTMANIPLLLQDEECRKKLVAQVKDPDVLLFWKRYERMKPSEQDVHAVSILRRVQEFLRALTRLIVGQSTTTIDFRSIMDERKILLVRLDRTLDAVTSLIGSMIVALILNASASRQTQRQFHLYTDEFQNFATEDFAVLLEQAGKCAIGVTMAHQNRSQLELSNKQADANLKARTLNVGNIVVFRVPTDAEELAEQFDTTPPPAKEEDITIIDDTEPIMTPRSDAIDWLLAGRTHGHPAVNNFISKWDIKNKNIQVRSGTIGTETTGFFDTINTLCYQAMVYKNPDTLSITVPFLLLLRTYGTHYNFEYYIDSIISIIPDYLWHNMTLLWLINLLHASQWGTLIDREYHKKMLTDCLYRVCSAIKVERSVDERTLNPQLLPSIQQQLHFHLPLSFQQEPYNNPWWVSIDLNRLQWFPTVEYVDKYPGSTSKQSQTIFKLGGVEGIQQVKDWYTPYALEREIDRIMASPKGAIQPKQVVVSFLSDLLTMLRVLAIDEFAIRDKSGLEQPHKRIQHIVHAQQSRADKKMEIAGQLVHLQKFTAWVKIAENIPLNPGKKCLKCGLLNKYGTQICTQCNTQLPAPNEYIITTLQPPKGIQQLDQRIKRIQSNNLRDGYVKKRADVEKEITQRQTGCSGGSAPVPPQPQQPSSQQQQAGHARQVPTCPTCGKSNPTGSKFCNQCGRKLK